MPRYRRFRPTDEPSPDPHEFIQYVDEDDSHLKIMDSDGVVSDLQAGAGGGLSLVDLGVVNAVDLIDGPATLYSPTAGQYVEIIVGQNDYVQPDGTANHALIALIGLDTVQDPAVWTSGADYIWDSGSGDVDHVAEEINNSDLVHGMARSGTHDFVAQMLTFSSDFSAPVYIAGSVAWAATTGYGTTEYVVAEGHVWVSSGGTSGSSTPDFAGNLGGTVVDNDITWTDRGAIPTQGSLHLYALVS